MPLGDLDNIGGFCGRDGGMEVQLYYAQPIVAVGTRACGVIERRAAILR
jgi:hypothetical protein